MKRMQCHRQVMLVSATTTLSLIYAYFFLFLPQHWSLIDHYKQVLEWDRPDFNPFIQWRVSLDALMEVGRFRPLDVANWMARFALLPADPRAFHLFQFLLLFSTGASLVALVKRFALSGLSPLFAIVLILGAFPTKDWIVHNSAAEPLACFFLFGGIAAYAAQRRWTGCVLYLAAIATKESFFVGISAFAVLEVFDRKRESRRGIHPTLLCMSAATLAFVVFVRSLPQVYTAAFDPFSLTIGNVARALVLPPLKNYSPAILWVVYARWKSPLEIRQCPSALTYISVALIISFTMILTVWGPFDSWLYLHIPIALSWALLLASLLPTNEKDDRISNALLATMLVFLAFVVINGARNFYSVYAETPIAAKLACYLAEKHPSARFYTNCHEPSEQLRNLLLVEKNNNDDCSSPPHFVYLRGARTLPEDAPEPSYLVWMKKCETFDFETLPVRNSIDLEWWRIIEKGSAK